MLKVEEILKKVFEKAEKGGYPPDTVAHLLKPDTLLWWSIGWRYYAIIFRHNFAKAFWGDEEIELANPDWCDSLPTDNLEHDTMVAWEYHLQQLVLCKEPLQYLKKFLDNTTQK